MSRTKKFIGKLRRRLDRYASMESGACGFDEKIAEAEDYRRKEIEQFVGDELDSLQGGGALGVVERTARGFELIEFTDCYGEKCSLQASSLAEFEKPGTSAVWLGCEEAKKHPATGEALSPRMHLSRKQVSALIGHLQNWLSKDSFK